MNGNGMSVREVLAQVKPGSTTEEALAAAFDTLSSGMEERHSPWFVRVLVGVSAWIASLMLLAFVFGSRIVSSSGGSMLLGSLLILAAVFLRRTRGAVLFLAQLALALSLAGQALLVSGMGRDFHTAGTAVVMIGLSVALIAFYPDKTHRFLSTLIAVFAAVAFIYDQHLIYGIQVLVAGLAAGAGHVWHEESRLETGALQPVMRPVGYGLVTGMFFLLVPSVVPPAFAMRYGLAQSWLPTTVFLTALLILLESRLLVFHGAMNNVRAAVVLFLGTAGLAVASFKAPGIIAALYLLALGFHRVNRIIMGISIVFLSVFLSAFYYSLDITLLGKSYILLASGALLIMLRIFLTPVFTFESGEATHE